MKNSNKAACFAAAVLAAAASIVGTAAAAETKAREYTISAQPLDQALRQFALSTGMDLLFPPELVAGRKSTDVKGTYRPDEALNALLKGTGLKYSVSGNRVTIAQPTALNTGNTGNTGTGEIRVAQNTDTPTGNPPSTGTGEGNGGEGKTGEQSEPSKNSSEAPAGAKESLQEVIVTGTYIRGDRPTASPISIYSRADIDRSGVSSVQDFFSKIPQNFGGGANPGNTLQDNAVGRDTSTFSGGASLNLRGLGAGKTLTLVNGQRLASSDSIGFVDVSMIPLSAVKRIEVLTDGASAIYGSDAVGGVVNLVLQDQFDGFETKLRAGTVTDGGMQEYKAGQTAGTTWDTGTLMLVLEHQHQDALSAADKSFSQNAPLQPYDLISEFKRDSAFATARQEITEGILFSSQAYFSRRLTTGTFTFSGAGGSSETEVELYGGSARLQAQLPGNWQARLDGGLS